ncbi:LacI family transcriptional regulator, partial [Klebsiella pneumoniae]|nr:LacI family transcriptional regulator [Klebsiella pneumoniae]
VSVATVSFVVNSSRTVSTSTRKKVEAAMRELKFQPNPMGRALAAQQTKIIGLLVPHAKESLSWNSVQALIGTTITAKEL